MMNTCLMPPGGDLVVQPLRHRRLEAGFMAILVLVLAGSGGALHIRLRQFEQLQSLFVADVAEQPQLLAIGHHYGRVFGKLHVLTPRESSGMVGAFAGGT
jgi:hypothetical protein